jgi:hypothetical protein
VILLCVDALEKRVLMQVDQLRLHQHRTTLVEETIILPVQLDGKIART